MFSGEIPTPKGEAEYDYYIFQLKLLRNSCTDDAIRNVIVARVCSHAKIAIRTIRCDSSLDAMLTQLENRFGLCETIDNHRWNGLKIGKLNFTKKCRQTYNNVVLTNHSRQ